MPHRAAPGGAAFAAAVLAAGQGSRFGGAKLAQDLGGRPLVAWPARAALRAGCGPVLVVTGFHQAHVAPALAGLEVELIANPRPERGMGSSLALAAARAKALGAPGLVVLLGDMPLVSPGLVARVAEAARTSASGAAAAQHQGKRGHPVAFGAGWLARLAGLGGDAGARDLLAGLGDGLALVAAGEECRLDVDTPQGLARAREAMTEKLARGPGGGGSVGKEPAMEPTTQEHHHE